MYLENTYVIIKTESNYSYREKRVSIKKYFHLVIGAK